MFHVSLEAKWFVVILIVRILSSIVYWLGVCDQQVKLMRSKVKLDEMIERIMICALIAGFKYINLRWLVAAVATYRRGKGEFGARVEKVRRCSRVA